MEKLQDFFVTLTPSELDELAPAGFDAKAPRGALKRIENSAIEKAGVRPAKRKRYFKPLMIAAAAVVASAATLFTVNAATDGNLVKFLFNDEEYSGDTYDYVDEDGVRHVTFDAVVPIEVDTYAVIFDADEPDQEKAVRVLTEESDPDFFEKLRAHYEKSMQIWEERNALRESGVSEDELPEFLDIEDYGIVLKDREICAYDMKLQGENEYHCGAFIATKSAEDWQIGVSSSGHLNYDNGTKTIHWEITFDNGN